MKFFQPFLYLDYRVSGNDVTGSHITEKLQFESMTVILRSATETLPEEFWLDDLCLIVNLIAKTQ